MATSRFQPLPAELVASAVRRALAEDEAASDITTRNCVAKSLTGSATFLAKSAGVICGWQLVAETLRQCDPALSLTVQANDGSAVAAGSVVGAISGPVRGLLIAERTALNFLQQLSGTATLAARFVEAVAGTGAVILDTRKTTPGLRAFEKYAVRCGGGTNHRSNLAAMAMIKDNHREALAREGVSLAEAVRRIRADKPVPVEIEVDSLAQLDGALEGEPEWILLDNMSVEAMAEAVRIVAGRAKLEASGGVTLQSVRGIAETGVDAISVGALTHSAPALDISLDIAF